MKTFITFVLALIVQILVVESRKDKILVSPSDVANISREIDGFSESIFLREIVCLYNKKNNKNNIKECYETKEDLYKNHLKDFNEYLTKIGKELMPKLKPPHKNRVLNVQSSTSRLTEATKKYQYQISDLIKADKSPLSVIKEGSFNVDKYLFELYIDLLDIFNSNAIKEATSHANSVKAKIDETKKSCDQILEEIKNCAIKKNLT